MWIKLDFFIYLLIYGVCVKYKDMEKFLGILFLISFGCAFVAFLIWRILDQVLLSKKAYEILHSLKKIFCVASVVILIGTLIASKFFLE